MKKLFFLALTVGALASCKKNNDTPSNNNNNNPGNGCGDGKVCHTLNGTELTKSGAGYVFSDTFTFVKWEEGTQQLSIDIFGSTKGSYTVGDKRLKGRGRIYYFPENNKMYMSNKGNLELSELTSDYKATGTFSGTLYKYDSGNNTFTFSDSMVITNGRFTKVQLVKSP